MLLRDMTNFLQRFCSFFREVQRVPPPVIRVGFALNESFPFELIQQGDQSYKLFYYEIKFANSTRFHSWLWFACCSSPPVSLQGLFFATEQCTSTLIAHRKQYRISSRIPASDSSQHILLFRLSRPVGAVYVYRSEPSPIPRSSGSGNLHRPFWGHRGLRCARHFRPVQLGTVHTRCGFVRSSPCPCSVFPELPVWRSRLCSGSRILSGRRLDYRLLPAFASNMDSGFWNSKRPCRRIVIPEPDLVFGFSSPTVNAIRWIPVADCSRDMAPSEASGRKDVLMRELENKIALVTGGGIGRGIAEAFLR